MERLAAAVGLVDARMLAYGYPLANLLEAAWHGIASRSDRHACARLTTTIPCQM
jgi:hypothetical protein